MSLNTEIKCRSVKEYSGAVLDKVEQTYNDSFPEAERRDFSLVRKLAEEESRFDVYVLTREDVYVGFMTAWRFDSFTYIEHFAIDESARNGGIGAESMKQFMSLCNTPLVLEVEIPADEMSRRRIGFYERLGYVLDNHIYYQPPYRQGEDSLEMRLMSFGDIDLQQSYEEVRSHIYRYVYEVE